MVPDLKKITIAGDNPKADIAVPAFPRVRVTAKGPEPKAITITRENSNVDFQLKPGKTIRLQFVDSDGKSIPGVYVKIEGWRGGKSLYNIKHPNVHDTKIPDKADKNGVWEWTGRRTIP